MPYFFEDRCHSFVAWVSHDYERVNGLFDDTINEIVHHVQADTTGNEVFTYSGMLKQDDYKQFFEAMVAGIGVHESRHHWTMMLRSDLPPGAKPIMGGFFSYNAQPPYKMGHQIKFWVPQLLGHKIGLLRCPRPILGWMSPI